MTIMRRSDWTKTAAPTTGVILNPSQVRGLAVHWNGPPVPASAAKGDRVAVAALLEQDRIFHTLGRGWSDIAYQEAIDNAGRRWQLRGWRRRSAANGDEAVNAEYGAVLCVIGEGQRPTSEMLIALSDAFTDFQRTYPRGTRLVTHNDVRPEPTSCPGPELTQYVHTFGRKDSDDMTVDELKNALRHDKELRQLIGAAVLESDKYGGKTLQEVLVAGSNAAQAVQRKLGAE